MRKSHPESLVEEAKSFCKKMTVIVDTMVAKKAGGVTSMHDATEGGVIGGLFEIANASNVGMEIKEGAFIHPEPVRAVCETFRIDPLSAIAEGSLLITAQPNFSRKIVEELSKVDIKASVIGKVLEDISTRLIIREDGSAIPLEIPDQDPFWPVFFEGVENV